MNTVLKVALGMIIGSVIIWGARYALLVGTIDAVGHALTAREPNGENKIVNFEKAIIKNAFDVSREVSKEVVKDYLKTVPKSKSQIIAENSAKLVQDVRNETKEFRKHYQKPEKCLDINDEKIRIWCANDFIQAKKNWDKEHLIATK